jgi:hypothetical protein
MVVVRWQKIGKGVVIVLCLALVASGAWNKPVQGEAPAMLLLDPSDVEVMRSDTITLALRVKNVEDLQRAELWLRYDQAGLEVQDVDPDRAGVQIEPGPLFEGGCAIQNEVAQGRITFVAQRPPTSAPFSGDGLIASITVRAKGSPLQAYTMSFDQTRSRLLNDEGQKLPIWQFTDARVETLPLTFELTGSIKREGWDVFDRSKVNAVLYPPTGGPNPVAWGQTCTGGDGSFSDILEYSQAPAYGLPDSDPTASASCDSRWLSIRLDFPNYLSECYWYCTDDLNFDIGERILEGGDVNKDNVVNILDIVRIIDSFNGTCAASDCCVPFEDCPCPSPAVDPAPPCDINGDCCVDILDLTQAAGNFDMFSNCPEGQLTAYE